MNTEEDIDYFDEEDDIDYFDEEDDIDYLNELRENHEYYNSGLDGWKSAVLNYLPHGSSMALYYRVQEFLDTINRVE